ncbi:hypothetical protein Tco_1387037 [Tanacetum coccineum]
MRTRRSNYPNSNVTIPRRRRRQVSNIVEPEIRTIVTPMAERTMEELLRAPTEGYGEAIVLPEINADHFEIKTNLLQLVQANPFYGRENDNPHAHINSFKRITSTLRFRNVPNDVINGVKSLRRCNRILLGSVPVSMYVLMYREPTHIRKQNTVRLTGDLSPRLSSGCENEELRELHLSITSRPHCTGSAGCGCEYSGFPSGKVGCAEALGGRCSSWVDDALVPWELCHLYQGAFAEGSNEPCHPGSYSMEDAELINENRIPINAYSESFLCHMGISRNYFQSPEEVPTFIGEDGREMDLFSVVHLSKPKLVTEGVRPLRDGEEPLLESTTGRTMKLVLEQLEVDSTDVLAPTPLHSVPGATAEPPRLDATSVGSSEDADVAGAESEAGEVDSGLKRKERHQLMTARARQRGVEAISASLRGCRMLPVPTPDLVLRRFEGFILWQVDQLMEEFDLVTAHIAALGWRSLRTGFQVDAARVYETDEGDPDCEDTSRSAGFCKFPVKLSLGCEVLGGGVKEQTICGLVSFAREWRGLLEEEEEGSYANSVLSMMRSFPYMLSAIAERRWLYAIGCACAMSNLESLEVKQSFGDVSEVCIGTVAYEELVATMEAMKLLELPHIAQLERDQDYPIDVIMAGLTLARHATEGAEAQPDYFLKPDVAQLQVPIFARPRDILNPFALEKEIPLKESLEAHVIRLAKKRGVKGKAILCGVGAAHIPRSEVGPELRVRCMVTER